MEIINRTRLIFQDDHFVGYVKQVSPKSVTIHFPSSPLLKKFYWNAEALQAGIVGNYVLIEGEEHGFLGQIAELSLPEKERMILNQTAFERDDFHPYAKIEILLSFSFYELKAEKGLAQLPPIGSKVFVCPEQILHHFLKEFGKSKSHPDEPNFEFASLTANTEKQIQISPQAIFGRHCAIVGTTGGGKSYTVAKLIEEIIRNNGKAILFDPTGEYETFSTNKKVVYKHFNTSDVNNEVFFHYSSLKETDFYAIFRPAGQIQLPKLQEAFKSLRLAKLLKQKNSEDCDQNDNTLLAAINETGVLRKQGLERNTVLLANKKYPYIDNALCDIDLKSLGYQVYYECIYENDFSSPTKFGKTSEKDLGSCFSLISRINTSINNTDFIKVFGLNEDSASPNNFKTVYDEFYQEQSQKNVLIFGLNRVPSSNNLRTILIDAFGRFLLEQSFERKFVSKPLIVFLDEAHLFLNKTIRDEYSIEVELNSFERIAKECRKFGLFLALSTQLPRDIPVGILSQFGTFLVHRLINQNDRATIEFASSEATKNALAFLPTLMPGQVLLTGVDFPMPIILQITPPRTAPNSGTPQIFNPKPEAL
jgi:uncharacterized protein